MKFSIIYHNSLFLLSHIWKYVSLAPFIKIIVCVSSCIFIRCSFRNKITTFYQFLKSCSIGFLAAISFLLEIFARQSKLPTIGIFPNV